ncbi:MAG TPA: FHA domain-containing protein [Kofleriaceae bacterium]|nr:FHA domain-containing protein [Kofleriaceae bacterium]
MISTTTDSLAKDWAIDDEVLQLRVWGTDLVYPLPVSDHRRLRVGVSPACEIQIHDPSSLTSREHAYLERVDRRWTIVDQSKNGLYLDDQQCERFLLTPGREIGLARYVTLVAESARTLALREALARMIGWSAARADAIDQALRMLRMAATGRAIFVLCGEPSLVPLAEELHRLTRTERRPFVLCDPRRRTGSEDTASFTKCATDGLTAVAMARDGTVCIDDQRRPRDLTAMLEELHRPGHTAQLMVLARNPRKADVYTPAPVVIPQLHSRRDELDRLVSEYEAEAVQRLGITTLELTPAQRSWIRERSSETLPDIQTAALRLVAIRHAGSLAGAAELLRISHTSLSRWLERRRLRADVLAAA